MLHLNLKKYKRFFAFGCSFTNYKWPTWADIIGSNVEYYENWGCAGKGNHYIFNSIVECDAKHKFNKDDLVLVMWSKMDREDRYSKGKWVDAYPAKLEETYGREWCIRYIGDERANLVMNLAMIKASQTLLNHSGCDWSTLAWSPIVNLDITKIDSEKAKLFQKNESAGIDYWATLFNNLADPSTPVDNFVFSDVIETYRDIFLNFKKCMYSTGLHKKGAADMHPTPLEHLHYIKSVWPDVELNAQLANWDIDQHYYKPHINRL